MVAVQRTAEVDWTGSIARGSGRASGGSGGLGDLPIMVASRFGEPEGKTSPEELIAAAHAACFTMALGSMLAARRTPREPDLRGRRQDRPQQVAAVQRPDPDHHDAVP
jgi:lipoyl-dependent peroxiredoxin